MTRRRIDPLAVAGAILLVLTIILAALGAQASTEDQGRTASIYDEGAGGAATLRRLLDGIGVRTISLEGDTFAPTLESERVLLMLHPSEAVTVHDVAAIHGYLSEGGTVVVAHDFEILITPLLESFDIRFAQAATPDQTRLSGPLFAAPPAHQIENGPGRELRLGPAWDAIGSDGRAPTVAMRTEGRGVLVVVGTVTPFLSESIEDADNARFAVDLISAALAQGGAVAFDEYHHGVHPAPSLLAVVERTWPGRALLFVLIVAFAYVALTGRRLGPPQPLDPRPPRSSLEYVRGLAGLVRRAGRQEIVRDRLRRELQAGLARGAGLDPATDLDQIIARLRAISPQRADAALAIDAQLRRRLREHDLVRTVARVAALLREEVA